MMAPPRQRRLAARSHIAPGYPAERFRTGQDVAMISNPTLVGHVVGFDPDGSVMVRWSDGGAVSGVDARNLRGLPPGYAGRRASEARRQPRRPEPKREAEAGFAIGLYDQGLIEDNLRDRIDPQYGDATLRREWAEAGWIDEKGDLTFKGSERLSKDLEMMERNAMAWLTAKFRHVRVDGHDRHSDLIGNVWFDPTNENHAHLIELASEQGRNERIDMNDAGFGDLANTAFDGVSDFGGFVLGGQINFFDVQPEDWETIEQTLEQARHRERARPPGGYPSKRESPLHANRTPHTRRRTR